MLIEQEIEELRAELNASLDRLEIERIEAELQAALARKREAEGVLNE